MVVSHPNFCDIEGFYHLALRHRIKLGKIEHEFYCSEDIIRNEYSLQEQETKKEKWRVYSKVLDFIHYFDVDYSPLSNGVTTADKINKIMSTFPKIMEAMNEKKQFFINSFPDKAREVIRKTQFTPNIGAGQLTDKKNPSYTIIYNKRTIVDKGKQIIGSTSAILEERPPEPSPKRRKIIREEDPHVEENSPSQTPIRIEEEQLTDEQIEQMGSQGGVFVT